MKKKNYDTSYNYNNITYYYFPYFGYICIEK